MSFSGITTYSDTEFIEDQYAHDDSQVALDEIVDAINLLQRYGFQEDQIIYDSSVTTDWSRFQYSYSLQLHTRKQERIQSNLLDPRKRGLPRKNQKMPKKPCLQCGELYQPNSNRDKYCSKMCATRNRCGGKFLREENSLCGFCGAAYEKTRPTQKYCTRECGKRDSAHKYICNGLTLTLFQWAIVLDCTEKQLRRRLDVGWDLQRAIDTPVKKYKPRDK